MEACPKFGMNFTITHSPKPAVWAERLRPSQLLFYVNLYSFTVYWNLWQVQSYTEQNKDQKSQQSYADFFKISAPSLNNTQEASLFLYN